MSALEDTKEVALAIAEGLTKTVEAGELVPGDRVVISRPHERFATLQGEAGARPSGMVRMSYSGPGLGYIKLYPTTKVVRLLRPLERA